MIKKGFGLPDTSTATPTGKFIDALVARPPSPLKLPDPEPATVEMTLVDAETLRMR